jgi:lipid-A-disaccharide synthase-like uncharacterized protein
MITASRLLLPLALLLLGGSVPAQAPAGADAELDALRVELGARLDTFAREHPDTGAARRASQLGRELDPRVPWGWYAFGLVAQTCFFCRFLVQWLASERAGESVVPITFWYFSIMGSLMLLTYAAIHLRDPVIILGQSVGSFIYLRNLVLIRRKRQRDEASP